MTFIVSKEKKDYIVDTYGTDINTVNKIIRIVNRLDLPFIDDEDFIVTIECIVSKLETEKFQKENGIVKDRRACYTISSAIATTLKNKFYDDYLYEENIIRKVLILK